VEFLSGDEKIVPLSEVHLQIDSQLSNTVAKDIEKRLMAEIMRSLRTPRFGVVNAVS